MTLLMFLHEDDSALVITDTLATDHEGKPLNFVDKCVAVPSMNLVVATTGYQQLMLRWVDQLRERVQARDIVMLDEQTPAVLREIWAELQAEHGPLPGTATVYHFGFDERTGHCRRFAYRSSSDFVSEAGLTPAFGVKPGPVDGSRQEGLSDDELIEFARKIRRQQDDLAEDRIYIGGDLVFTKLSRNAILSRRVFRWEDQYDHWQEMCGAPPLGIVARLP
jgi:hypothetical protein